MGPAVVIGIALCVAAIKSEECGMGRSIFRALSDAVHSEPPMPWDAIIYKRNEDNEMEPICAGTLISPHIVLTAAHCVTNNTYINDAVRPETIMVALGKRFPNWTTCEPTAVTYEVREVRIPTSYTGFDTYYANDMALIDLKVPLNNSVTPACVDWNRAFELTPGELGTIAVWNWTGDGAISNLQVPYDEYTRCVDEIPPGVRRYLTSDQFCSILEDVSLETLRRHSGAGLTFVRDGRHYVRGVRDAAVTNGIRLVLAYTNVQYAGLSSWLQHTKRLFDKAHEDVQPSRPQPLPSAGCVLPQQPQFGNYTSAVCVPNGQLSQGKGVPGTTGPRSWLLTFKCNEGYRLEGAGSNGYAVCVNGSWSPAVPVCKPIKSEECGMGSSIFRALSDAVHSEPPMPWHAIIYRRKEDNEMKPICAGTLISKHIVLTAAHCVKNHRSKYTVRPDTIVVALGKRFPNWTTYEPTAVTYEVRDIRVPSTYYGHDTHYAHDMALIDLKVPLNNSVMPACVDWNRSFELTPRELGTTAGWNVTGDGAVSKFQVPYDEYTRCIDEIRFVFRHYLTPDKFCSILNDVSVEVFTSHRGAGLTLVRDGRHYVQGVLSEQPRRSSAILTFTNVQYAGLSSWLQDTKRLFDKAHEEVQPSR